MSGAASGLYARALLLGEEEEKKKLKQQKKKDQAAMAAKAATPVPPSAQVTREAAHNLSLILKASGDDRAARAVLRKYATV